LDLFKKIIINEILWLAVLFVGFLETRILCRLVDLPRDCRVNQNFVSSLVFLFSMGYVQGRVSGVFQDQRFLKFPWLLIFFSTFPLFSIISETPTFDQSVVSDSPMPWNFQVALLLLSTLVMVIILWHVFYSWRLMTRTNFRRFWLLRAVGAVVIIGGYGCAVVWGGGLRVHLHHYFLSWCLSLIAVFDEPVSCTFLAVTSAIFVQGLAAYSADPILIPGNF